MLEHKKKTSYHWPFVMGIRRVSWNLLASEAEITKMVATRKPAKRTFSLDTSKTEQYGSRFPDDIFKGFSRMRMFEFRIKFHLNVFSQV